MNAPMPRERLYADPLTLSSAELYRDARLLNALYVRQHQLNPYPFETVTGLPLGPVELTKDLCRTLARVKLRQAREAWLREHGA